MQATCCSLEHRALSSHLWPQPAAELVPLSEYFFGTCQRCPSECTKAQRPRQSVNTTDAIVTLDLCSQTQSRSVIGGVLLQSTRSSCSPSPSPGQIIQSLILEWPGGRDSNTSSYFPAVMETAEFLLLLDLMYYLYFHKLVWQPYQIEQRSPTFQAAGIGFMADNFWRTRDVEGAVWGWLKDITFIVRFISNIIITSALPQLHLWLSGIRARRLGTPGHSEFHWNKQTSLECYDYYFHFISTCFIIQEATAKLTNRQVNLPS